MYHSLSPSIHQDEQKFDLLKTKTKRKIYVTILFEWKDELIQ